MKIKKGDKVKVMAGKDKGREGKVEKVYLKSDKVLIANINIYKRHVKKSEQMPKGGIVDVPRPLAVSKVIVICSKCGKTTRIGYKIEKSKKYRVCKKCKSKI
ncbi:50S ribosomal protein L24 [Candidatus Roizmanbacteria bacterium CG22_combo_CG10-13_8_21_14_all_35_9]|uniref:Large ribosomal subunit protein uL24 n=4 Tax=Candidatus Roizmaniibacteriota TaxID=1752723 RepID=A0A2M8F4N7_9BACT|nr:MAG: 50S ribosomal protein L24 [Candidatus Roizmanbacteria bacterium CG23_combo_of_CG06-09_8_20_14_all_35_49]PIP62651.1 MAG: 50S ribosomal protein L24 [Candidatus Roizmanbacteria bacterium CG22_combo_CG10-13_8_21_14_all_35_9]PIY71186.1 MAG: 50S ribosomal protein L24 [Candidatus Roizmanbacteria bacterium CG_4_10_14_0_8_um_filter_35_28]PJC34242.1 MAG: 50S ribosomal protein L24 [Candidatus Roizmanbacteria bacterium CG_4_9_14_0_2_um_filter_35_15]PJC82614.1 MAG: 50S ribosomal protein L24 [Candida